LIPKVEEMRVSFQFAVVLTNSFITSL